MGIDWTIIFSIGGSFGAASTAQYFSHRLTLKREDEKYKKEKYQKFYSPLVFKIVKYIEAEGNKISGINELTNPDSKSIFASIITTIEKNIQYANSDFIKIYEEARTSEMIDTISLAEKDDNYITRFLEAREFNNQLNAFEQFFTDYLIISKDLKVLSSKVEEEVKGSIAIIKIYNLFFNYGFVDTAKLLFASGGHIIYLDNDIDSLIKELDDVHEITNTNFQPYFQTRDALHDDCYDNLFTLLQKINRRIFPTKCSIKDALNQDIKMIALNSRSKISIRRLDDFDF
ncbi:hypothetical protein ABRZ22_25980 [Bacillus pacificus]|uniref:hypothetical protein n=1 Tax=Bacillus pacificus TaxID=2026187 RepID=UPI003EE38408